MRNPSATSRSPTPELLKEVLQVNKRRVQTGEVTLRKEVITEMQTVQVPVTREKLITAGNHAEVATGEIGTRRDPGAAERGAGHSRKAACGQ